MSSGFDIEQVAQITPFGDVDGLASYVARNPDVPIGKLARHTRLSREQVERLLTDKGFRERVTEVMTYAELSPENERKILRRMLSEATNESTPFKDFERAATWVYRQGGMLKGDKTDVGVSGAIKVAFTLDDSVPGHDDVVDVYQAPDPLAGVVGLPSPSEGEPQSASQEVASDGAPRGDEGEAQLAHDEGGT